MDQRELLFLECDRRYTTMYKGHSCDDTTGLCTPRTQKEFDPIRSLRAEYIRLFTDYEHKFADQEKLNTELQYKVNGLENYVQQLDEQIDECENTIKDQQAKIIELESTVDALGNDVSYLESQISSAL